MTAAALIAVLQSVPADTENIKLRVRFYDEENDGPGACTCTLENATVETDGETATVTLTSKYDE